MQFKSLFFEAFDTFKVFDDLTIDIVTQTTPGSPNTIWQILNHLIIWQESQLLLLTGKTPEKPIKETETWIESEAPSNQHELHNAVAILNAQLVKIEAIISTFSLTQADIEFKLKTLQDMAIHLSFHLGEIVLMRRQCGNYPMPDDMKAFLG